MALALRLLMGSAGSGAFSGTRSLPSSWGITRYSGNPQITVSPGNVNETHEQYVPACIQLPNGDIWIYVKGAATIYAWKSTNGGSTFTIQNGSNPVISRGAGGTWDATDALEPAALYDAATDTIHLWYKGFPGPSGSGWSWGHATGPGSTPTVFTKDAANPILLGQDAAVHFGGAAVADFAISDVILIGSTFHFYGYIEYNGVYQLIQTTGTTWNNPSVSGLAFILSSGSGTAVVEVPSVITVPGIGPPLYAMFYSRGTSGQLATSTRVGHSTDGATWDFSDTTDILSPTSGWEANQTFAGHMLKDSLAPYSDPLSDSLGRFHYYYSGIGGGAGNANSGLAYSVPVWP